MQYLQKMVGAHRGKTVSLIYNEYLRSMYLVG